MRDIALLRKDYATYIAEARRTADLAHDAAAIAIADAAREGLAEGGGPAMFESVQAAEKTLYAQGRLSAYSLAQTCALMGEKEAAFGYLRRALQARDSGMLALRNDFQVRGLHDDPRFGDLLRRIGLPPLI